MDSHHRRRGGGGPRRAGACFTCGELGHRAAACPRSSAPTPATATTTAGGGGGGGGSGGGRPATAAAARPAPAPVAAAAPMDDAVRRAFAAAAAAVAGTAPAAPAAGAAAAGARRPRDAPAPAAAAAAAAAARPAPAAAAAAGGGRPGTAPAYGGAGGHHHHGAPHVHTTADHAGKRFKPDEEGEDDEEGSGGMEAAPAMSKAFLSDVTYADPSIARLLSAGTMRAITETFKFSHMSKVQAATLPVIMGGKDVFGKAKTGSGKTLAFLIPIVELLQRAGGAGGGAAVRSLVIAPTRELALQIEAEARTLLTFHPGVRVASVIGGRNINSERSRMGFGGGGGGGGRVDILIATPGRLIDHMESTPGFRAALLAVRFLVMDEADRLLDMGFRPALERILAALPRNTAAAGGRQNLLFSATVSPDVLAIGRLVLHDGFDFVDCVTDDEPDTNVQVYQEALVLPSHSLVPALARVLDHMATTDATHKVIVFFTTARLTGYMATLFERMTTSAGGRFNIVEIHSRKSQSARTAAAERFKRDRGIIMFSSDVSARGMDFPDVTRVVQVGLTDRDQYVHRLGRTARAGRSGAGLLMLADFEASFLSELKDIPYELATATSTLTGGSANGVVGHPAAAAAAGAAAAAAGGAGGSRRVPAPAPDVVPSAAYARALATIAPSRDGVEDANRAYAAWLGFYNGHLRRVHWTKEALVAHGNALWLTLGCPEVPVMARDTLGKMGLRGVTGIRQGPPGWKPGRD